MFGNSELEVLASLEATSLAHKCSQQVFRTLPWSTLQIANTFWADDPARFFFIWVKILFKALQRLYHAHTSREGRMLRGDRDWPCAFCGMPLLKTHTSCGSHSPMSHPLAVSRILSEV